MDKSVYNHFLTVVDRRKNTSLRLKLCCFLCVSECGCIVCVYVCVSLRTYGVLSKSLLIKTGICMLTCLLACLLLVIFYRTVIWLVIFFAVEIVYCLPFERVT